jgi:hypothetical protein
VSVIRLFNKSKSIFFLAVMPDLIPAKDGLVDRHQVCETLKKRLDSPSTLLRVVSPSALLRTMSLSNGTSNHGSGPREDQSPNGKTLPIAAEFDMFGYTNLISRREESRNLPGMAQPDFVLKPAGTQS